MPWTCTHILLYTFGCIGCRVRWDVRWACTHAAHLVGLDGLGGWRLGDDLSAGWTKDWGKGGRRGMQWPAGVFLTAVGFFDEGTSYQTKVMMMMMMMMMQPSLFGFHLSNYGSEHSIASVLGPKNVLLNQTRQ